MRAIDVYRQMADYVAAHPQQAGARAQCGKSSLYVLPRDGGPKAYILGDGAPNWSREATLAEIEMLPETVGDEQGNESERPPYYRMFGENLTEALSGRHNHRCSPECLYAAVGKLSEYR